LHTQYQEKVNVWASFLNNTLIGPFFIEENLNIEIYKYMLKIQKYIENPNSSCDKDC